MSSFYTKKEELKKFFNTPHVDKQEGVYFVYATDAEALQKLIPPELTLVAPFVIGYSVNIAKPNFAGSYMEFALGVPCAYGDCQGLYPLSLMLEGEGALMGTLGGREADGLPKKLAESIIVERDGETVTASVTRKGVKIFDFKMELGQYNDEAATNFFAAPEGAEFPGNTFLYKYDYRQTEDGSCEFSNGSLNNLIMLTKNEKWTPGSAVVTTTSSVDDPYGELPVLKVLGGAYVKHDTVIMSGMKKLADVDPLTVLQYQFASRYDQSMLID